MCNTWCFAEFTGASSVPSCVHISFFYWEVTEVCESLVSLKPLQQFALKTNDNFGFFFGMMHRPDTSIRGAWNAAGDDSECYNRTGSPIFVWIFQSYIQFAAGQFQENPLQQAIEEQIAVFFVSMGCNHSWSGFTFQICISSTLACYSSWTTVDVGRTRHWILKSFWGGWLYPIQRWCATSWFAVPFHPWHRHRFAVCFVFGSCDLLWKQWCGDSIIGMTIHTFFQHGFLSDTNKR